jgi:Protein of unknown function (DUF3300)
METRQHFRALTTAIFLAGTLVIPVQAAIESAPQGAPASAAQDKPPLSQEELEALVAPVALYPDSLLSQILMSSTYPLEIVEADRFVKANKDLKGDALGAQLEKQDWDPSVKSLVNFPTVLDMMSDKLDTTSKLGDAFLDDQKRVLDAVQKLRAKAQAQGNLKSNEQQKVIVQQQASTQVIVIEPAQPSVVYVPQYNPTVVYGSWPYPAYPPAPYYPPGSAFVAGAIGFGVGVACGAAWGYAWGNCNWGHGDVNINVNQNTNFNKNIDRSKYQNQINNLNNRPGGGGSGTWQHDPAHRGGVAYRDNASAQKYGGASVQQATQARDAYRGRTDAGAAGAGRGNLGAGGAGTAQPNRGNAAAGNLGAGGAGAANGGNNTGNLGAGGAGAQNRAPAASNRTSTFDGINSGGNNTRAASDRGAASRGGGSLGGGGSRPSGGARPAGGGGGRRR